MMHSKPIRVLVVDDHEVVREGLRVLLNKRHGVLVVGDAGTVQEAVDMALQTRPDVVVMDVRLPDGTGIEACREIRSTLPDAKIVMLTSYSDEEAVMASILAGACAYLLKETRAQDLAAAVEAAARGTAMLDPLVTARVLERMRRGHDGVKRLVEPLTPTETTILQLLSEGKTNREIAREIKLSDKTVKNYVSNILAKLNLRRRSGAAAYIARRTPDQTETAGLETRTATPRA